ncbi:unnamed protein product, partial [Ectocarpus sp. 4 AP-2014]
MLVSASTVLAARTMQGYWCNPRAMVCCCRRRFPQLEHDTADELARRGITVTNAENALKGALSIRILKPWLN